VINWWNEEKTIFPNCKDVIKRSTRIKFYESYATQYIDVSQKNNSSFSFFASFNNCSFMVFEFLMMQVLCGLIVMQFFYGLIDK
jgi:hypothetical protein